MDEQPPVAGSGTKEAMSLLKETKGLAIQWGMHYAVKIAMRKLTVHSREVWEEMARDGVLPSYGKAFWLGSVFRELKSAGVLVKTGHFFKYSDEARNIHERTVPLWELNDKADLTPYRVPPKEKP